MKPKTLILTVVAVVCGLVASYMTTRFLADQRPSEVEEVDVLVVMKNLPMGEIIKDEKLLGIKKFPKNFEPKGALKDAKDVKGKMLKRSLREHEWITQDDLYNDKDVLQYNLPDGFRALGIRVTNEGIAAGFAAMPHSRVDIISTVRRGDDSNSFSQVLLEDVLVLAADNQDVRTEGARAMPATVVTVALKPEDVVKVNMAKDMGTLSLVLRKFDEKKSLKLAKITAQEVAMGGAPAKEAPKKEEIKVVVVEPPPLVKKKVEPAYRKHRIRFVHGDRIAFSTPVLLDDKNQPVIPDVEVMDLEAQVFQNTPGFEPKAGATKKPGKEDKPEKDQKAPPAKDTETKVKDLRGAKKEVLFDNNRLVKGFKDRDGCFYKVYDLRMVKGNTYVIEMTSKEFDTYLLLEDGNGQLLYEDDDGAGTNNSRLIFRPEVTDSYRILASTFIVGGTGNYQIQVYEIPEPAAR